MTLGENKKITLGLIEEYSNTNPKLTDDVDIQNRINFLYATNYQELSQRKKILKTKTLKEVTEEKLEPGYTEYTLPSSMYQFKRVIALDENNNTVDADYYTLGKRKIYINNESNANYILEYYGYPSIINEDTDNDFTLELDQDVLFILPYAVANDILKTDPSADYSAFLSDYNRKLENLNTSISNSRVVIKRNYTL